MTAYLAIRRLKKEYPKIWQNLQAAWDPKGEYVSRFINHVETTSTLQGIKPDTEVPKETVENAINTSNDSETVNNTVNVFNRFAEDNNDNEISSSVATNSQSSSPNSPLREEEKPASQEPNIAVVASSTTPRPTSPPVLYTNIRKTTTDPIFRQPLRPTRFNVLPRPVDLSRLTANVFESIADVGTKVIRTGARIADMVISGVQASVRPLLVNNNNN